MCRCSCARTIRPHVIDYREPATSPCRICGGNPDAIVNAVKMGMQMAAFDTYASNLAATEEREAAERARQTVARWHE